MHGEVVDKRRWIDEPRFLRALDVCMLLPGPEATQLAMWMGWRLHGWRGAVVAGAGFVLPAALLLAALSAAYVAFGHVPAAAGVVFGLQAAVLGIVAHAVQRIGGRVLRTPAAVVLALAALALSGRVPFPLLVLGAAAAGALLQHLRPGALPVAQGAAVAGAATQRGGARHALVAIAAGLLAWWLPLLAVGAWLGRDSTAFTMGLFFSRAALVTFGGAYAVLPYVAHAAVATHGWLDAGQMAAGLGLAETTPGPLILVLEFVGFVGGWQRPDLASPWASALLCAGVTLWATFLPSLVFVLGLAPWIERLGARARLAAALAGVTAAVVGVIAHLALWFGIELLRGRSGGGTLLALGLAVAVYLGLAWRRWPVAALVPAAGAVGLLAGLAGATA